MIHLIASFGLVLPAMLGASAPGAAPGAGILAGAGEMPGAVSSADPVDPASGAVRAAISAALEGMERAVLAGDDEAYLSFVYQGEPKFAASQRFWARDLKETRPDEFSLTMLDGPARFGDDRAEFEMEMSWRIDGWSGGRPWTVREPVVFVRDDGRWRFAGLRWNEREEDGYTIRFADGLEDVAADVAAAFPLARARVHKDLDVEVTEHQIIELYDTREQVVASVSLSVADWIPGWVEPGESIKFWHEYSVGPGWEYAFSHEYGHVGTFELGPHANEMPWWVIEGLAEDVASEATDGWTYESARREVERRARRGTLPSWEQIGDFEHTDASLQSYAYSQGHHMVAFVRERSGREGRNAWVRAMSSGKSLDEATREALGVPFAELDGEWREALEARAGAPASRVRTGGGRRGDAAPEPSMREGIEALLSAMEGAVLAADVEGYLALVSGDGVLMTEERNWARDLERVPVEAFDLELSGEPKADGERAVLAELRAVWTSEGGRERRLVFPARFERTDAGWRYGGRAWNIVSAPGIEVFYDEGLERVAQSVVDELPEVMEYVNTGFEIEPPEDRVQHVKLYRSMLELQYSIYLSYTDGLSGWNEPGESIKIMTGPEMGRRGLRTLLAHEYGHVATFIMGEKITDAPWWVLEGVAELAAEKYSVDGDRLDRMIRGMAEAGTLAAWEDLADFHTVPQSLMMHVYMQGHHMVGYVSDRFLRAGRNAWLRALAGGATLDEATRSALGMSFADLDAAWRASLGSDRPVTSGT
ncbi:MAG: hypothetical protein H6811_07600 [Phycisphaeraceae bacterium]|nr:hypothetical protein [Phycisphaeraceae bacterium]